jgi:hypothetical protein
LAIGLKASVKADLGKHRVPGRVSQRLGKVCRKVHLTGLRARGGSVLFEGRQRQVRQIQRG